MKYYQPAMVKKNGMAVLVPEFNPISHEGLMTRGKAFYAVWDEEKGLWSKDEADVGRMIDEDLMTVRRTYPEQEAIRVALMREYSSGSWKSYLQYVRGLSDNYIPLDSRLTFLDTKTKMSDYASKRLPYNLEDGECPAFKELIETLYERREREKLEWAIGSVVAGDSVKLQKFLVLYGEAGTGKSTILNIIQDLFTGYWVPFDGKALTAANGTFSTAPFANNPLVVIQHDADLSRIEDNSRLNSIVSHETIMVNEKYKAEYPVRPQALLFLGTNRPVKITEAKSGVIRRLIDVSPSGKRVPPTRYIELMNQIKFEHGAIANYCKKIYQDMGQHYYDTYKPFEMIERTDVFYNFVDEYYREFKDQDGISLKQAYAMYKEYCDESFMEFKLPMYKFREELKNYFRGFSKITRVDGKQVRSWYSGFCSEKFEEGQEENIPIVAPALKLEKTESLLDIELAECLAQYSTEEGIPAQRWSSCTTALKDIRTYKEHYVKPPLEHIVIDFDLKDDNGEKCAELNLREAAKWPPTYAEFSKSGKGVHLHYIYEGDVMQLSRVYADGIEIKIFNGNSALRRKLSYCNDLPVAKISSGLPMKGATKPVLDFKSVQSERGLRNLIARNLNKEIHPGTKPSIDLIFKNLQDAYDNGIVYDVTDLRPKILTFAMHSSNHAAYCVKMVNKMKFKSETTTDGEVPDGYSEEELVFYDVEVFPNLLLINYLFDSGDKCVRLINPSPTDVEALFKYRLVGFNCRRYDNHILYARYLGKTNEEIYQISQRIINKSANAFFGEAYDISYTDVYDFASAGNKKSLKKFEIELGIHHQELGLPWDQPVPEDKWEQVAEYCDNDVFATRAVFHHLKGDWVAREVLSRLSGLNVNATTNQQTTRIIFGGNRKPQNEFIYTNLGEPIKEISDEHKEFLQSRGLYHEEGFEAWDGQRALLPFFPGYTFDHGKSIYRGIEVGEGGYVYAEPGCYYNVGLLDIASMHPTSAENLCCFGPRYTKRFCDVKDGRVAVKHNDEEALRSLLDGKLYDLVSDPSVSSDDVSGGLKTAINSVYGLTSARFDNPFKDPRNIDNIVAKRGALFMVDLQKAVQAKGWTVAHIKTDSIKLPDITPEKVEFVMEFGRKYGYTFEFEAVYERMCLVNNAVYIAKYDEQGIRNKGGKHASEWTATGAQFAQPYVFKTLFSGDEILFGDLCEQRSVDTALYLDMNEGLGEDEHAYVFIGKTGLFCPIKPGCGGGELMREKDGKYYAASNTIGYRWLEAELVQNLNKQDDIDVGYFDGLVTDACTNIGKYCDVEAFVGKEHFVYPWTSAEETLPF